jgi:hypothetical protein
MSSDKSSLGCLITVQAGQRSPACTLGVTLRREPARHQGRLQLRRAWVARSEATLRNASFGLTGVDTQGEGMAAGINAISSRAQAARRGRRSNRRLPCRAAHVESHRGTCWSTSMSSRAPACFDVLMTRSSESCRTAKSRPRIWRFPPILQISQFDNTMPCGGRACGNPSRIIRRSVQWTRYPAPTRRR